MHTVGRLTRTLALTLSVVLTGALGGVQLASAASISEVTASYNGGTIDLSQGWGTATVCAVTETGTHCFATQSDYQVWLTTQSDLSGLLPAGSGNCSTGLELFQNISYGGTELVIYVKSIWLNLSTYSFSDALSSYKVGACSISMTDAPNGGGNVYPGATSAGSDVSWIGTAWNDRVQSVYIY
jgi:hypothetical protein